MAEQLNKIMDNIKAFWEKQTPKMKKIIIGLGAAVLIFALGLAVLLNVSKMGYKIIFPGMTNAEASEVYNTLIEMGVQAQIDSAGNVRVPSGQWDNLQYQLSAVGYPKTTLTYDVFSDMSGFTTTEFEKRVALTYQLQDRIQSTLRRWNGIADAAVTINIPESSNFVWNQAQQEAATASVSVTMQAGYTLSPEQVSAIKNHTASAVPKLTADNVVVIDAATGVEPPSAEDTGSPYSTSRLEFERQIEKALEDNVKRLLVPTYGVDGVTAVAKVSVDYDRMVTERREVLPQEDTGSGVATHTDEHYTVDGNVLAQGIAGENDNTDLPTYPNLGDLDGNEITTFDRSIDYDVGYILTQIEKGEPVLKEASLAVIVNDANFTDEKESLLIDLISKSVNISPYDIMVANLDFTAPVAGDTQPEASDGLSWQAIALIAVAAVAVIALIILIVFMVIRSNRRKKQEALEAEAALEESQRQRDLEREIADHKRMLAEEAQNVTDLKESAITEEVRDFASRNPEITANLIRSLMKEDR